jgi:hypothetical protein
MAITNLRAHHAGGAGGGPRGAALSELRTLMQEDPVWGADPAARAASVRQYAAGSRGASRTASSGADRFGRAGSGGSGAGSFRGVAPG